MNVLNFPRGISTAANSSWWNLINYKNLTLNQCSTCRYINILRRELKLMILKMICIIWRNFMIDYHRCSEWKEFFIFLTRWLMSLCFVFIFIWRRWWIIIKKYSVVVVRCIQKVLGMLWNSFSLFAFHTLQSAPINEFSLSNGKDPLVHIRWVLF